MTLPCAQTPTIEPRWPGLDPPPQRTGFRLPERPGRAPYRSRAGPAAARSGHSARLGTTLAVALPQRPHPGHRHGRGGTAPDIYHEVWTQQRAEQKHAHATHFAQRLPAARKVVSEHLDLPGLPRERTLAAAFRLLDLGLFRVGGESYAEENGSFGLATLRMEHLTISGDAMQFEYNAKSGQHRKLRLNAYVKDVISADASAKDFRTWHATVLAAVALSGRPKPASATAAKRAVSRAMKEVAEYLGNTPAVCRASYVDPRVIDRFTEGTTISAALRRAKPGKENHPTGDTGIERAVLRLLRD